MPSTISYIEATFSAFPLPVAARSLLRNSEFNDPFTGDSNTGWQSSGGYLWQTSGFVSLSCNSSSQFDTPYLYQEITAADPMVVGATYEVRVGVSNFLQGNAGNPGRLVIQLQNGYTSPAGQGITADGDFVFQFNASGTVERFHLRGYGSFTCDIEYCRLVRV